MIIISQLDTRNRIKRGYFVGENHPTRYCWFETDEVMSDPVQQIEEAKRQQGNLRG